MWPTATLLPAKRFIREPAVNKRTFLLAGAGGVIAAVGAAAAISRSARNSAEDAYHAASAAARAGLAEPAGLKDIVRYATLAANGHNTQPWRFRISEDRVEIRPDLARRTPVVDPDDHHLFTSLGCATENLILAAGACGRPATPRFDPANDGAVIVEFASGAAHASALFEAIPRRQSTRAEYDGRSVGTADLKLLSSAAAVVPGVDLILITERGQIDRVRDLVVAGNSAQMADAAFVAELKQWIRFNPRQALQTGDGLYSATSGNPTLPAWLGRRVFDFVFDAAAENEKYVRQLRGSAGVAVFVAHNSDREHWIRAGQACQRFALQATALGLKHAFLNQPVEVARLRPELAALVGMPGRRPDIVMRFGYGPALPYSPRRPVEAVLA
jgi:nitroreductase